MAVRELQGWHPDPFGLHEMRYFSVGRPTKLVRDGRAEAYDEPPDDWSTVMAAAADGQQAGGTRTQAPPVGLSAPPKVGQPTAATTMPTPATPGQSDPAAPAHVFRMDKTDQAAAVAQGPVARPQRRRMEYAFVAAGAVVAVLVFVALGGGSGKPGIAPAAFVTKAAQQTLTERTADFTLYATARVAGETIALGGSGQIDLANGSMAINVGGSASGGSVTETELEVGGNSYLKITVNGRGLPLSGGRQWIEMPFPVTAPWSFATASPDSSLAVLSEPGARVTQLGSRKVDGQNCNGYSVTPSSQAMMTAARQEFAKIGTPAAETTTALAALQKAQPPTIAAWFGSHSDRACEITFDMQFGAPTSSGSGTVQAQLTFTHYGVPVKISAPSASDTVSLRQFLRGSTHL